MEKFEATVTIKLSEYEALKKIRDAVKDGKTIRRINFGFPSGSIEILSKEETIKVILDAYSDLVIYNKKLCDDLAKTNPKSAWF